MTTTPHAIFKKYRLLLTTGSRIALTAILIEVLLLPFHNDVLLFIFFISYGVYVYYSAVSSRTTFALALPVALSMAIFYALEPAGGFSERLAEWLFLLLMFGIIQQWRELRTS